MVTKNIAFSSKEEYYKIKAAAVRRGKKIGEFIEYCVRRDLERCENERS